MSNATRYDAKYDMRVEEMKKGDMYELLGDEYTLIEDARQAIGRDEVVVRSHAKGVSKAYFSHSFPRGTKVDFKRPVKSATVTVHNPRATIEALQYAIESMRMRGARQPIQYEMVVRKLQKMLEDGLVSDSVAPHMFRTQMVGAGDLREGDRFDFSREDAGVSDTRYVHSVTRSYLTNRITVRHGQLDDDFQPVSGDTSNALFPLEHLVRVWREEN